MGLNEQYDQHEFQSAGRSTMAWRQSIRAGPGHTFTRTSTRTREIEVERHAVALVAYKYSDTLSESVLV